MPEQCEQAGSPRSASQNFHERETASALSWLCHRLREDTHMVVARLTAVPVRIVAPLTTAATASAVAAFEAPLLRRAVALTLRLVWLYFVTGLRG
jgi:hypothetical protein